MHKGKTKTAFLAVSVSTY